MDMPECVTEALLKVSEQLRTLNPRLSGGAVRDSILGKPVKDWDVFTDMDFGRLNIATQLVLDGWTLRPLEKASPYFERAGVRQFFKFVHAATGTELEIISNGMEIEQFDHAICQCSFDLISRRLVTTPEFHKCIDRQVHRIFVKNLRTVLQSYKCFHNHTPRILEKYPWPVELCYE